MGDKPGPIYEAQIVFYKPSDLPFSIRLGKFEPWYAKSPGKTQTHFGYSPLSLTSGANDSTLANSKPGIGTIWYISQSLLAFVDIYYLEGGPEGFIRLVAKTLDGEVGVFVNSGSRRFDRFQQFEDFRDNYIRPGIDFAIFPVNFLEVSGFAAFALHTNPTGEGERKGYISSYLETEIFPFQLFAVVLRGELLRPLEFRHEEGTTETAHQGTSLFPKHVEGGESAEGAETTIWGVISLQHYIRQNAKILAEFKANFNELEKSVFFVGTHFAF
ncbi:hypothetical protein HRbin19_00010 [bacterium HR19]|nr:hypothetical protein HRbin19_00010 [bacterium HR19]